MESRKISEKFQAVIKNKGLKQEQLGKRMGMTRQGVNYVLKHRDDSNWSDKEIDYWCKCLGIDSFGIYEIREKVYGERKTK